MRCFVEIVVEKFLRAIDVDVTLEGSKFLNLFAI
jgi:hypothetical protein